MSENDPAHNAEGLTYAPIGGTQPAEPEWSVEVPGYRHYERTATIGHGEADWREACAAVMDWEVKHRSGFQVEPVTGSALRATEGHDYRIKAAIGPFTIHEPVRVVAAVETLTRCGFAYGTLPGHPVSGEEAFIVHRSPDGTVWLTLRSLTRPASKASWRLAFPALLIAQRHYRRRYLRALRPRY
ncbi:DUF1990 family protein [Nocardia sp. SYP-A9097]|uniref:DUF1990 family protein n=1 Tax=Nocardia sp. SYP-A9097 TaxID=2663237 RepID=UPI00129A2988|nr:DUF1990 domain-containing protein [Nocardia sp. SYP-A9097]MRH93081.1 DUF1990 family protein [Nocardia sp. SYP-A9097]